MTLARKYVTRGVLSAKHNLLISQKRKTGCVKTHVLNRRFINHNEYPNKTQVNVVGKHLTNMDSEVKVCITTNVELRVHTQKLILFFLNQNICRWFSKESYQ